MEGMEFAWTDEDNFIAMREFVLALPFFTALFLVRIYILNLPYWVLFLPFYIAAATHSYAFASAVIALPRLVPFVLKVDLPKEERVECRVYDALLGVHHIPALPHFCMSFGTQIEVELEFQLLSTEAGSFPGIGCLSSCRFGCL